MLHDLTDINNLGPKTLAYLQEANITTPLDLLQLIPVAYQDKTRITPVEFLQLDKTFLIQGTVVSSKVLRLKRSIWQLEIQDHGYSCMAIFFHFNPFQVKNVTKGKQIRLFGTVKLSKNKFTMYHPEYWVEPFANLDTTLTPVYKTITKVPKTKLARYIKCVLHSLIPEPEILPSKLVAELNLLDYNQAVNLVHNLTPEYAKDALNPGLKRLCFEEILAYMLGLMFIKHKQVKGTAISFNEVDYAPLLKRFGYALTEHQQKVINEMHADIKSNQPMQRLIQGDVGSGKTIVAAIISHTIAKQQHQVAFMAPTSLLAKQVAQNFTKWMPDLNIALLLGGHTKTYKQDIYEKLGAGTIDIVVGTHSLFQEQVSFNNLSLVIIDEQHRFGVKQRLALRQKSTHEIHQVFLSATPIPRTIALSLYGDLKISEIKTMPKNRIPIATSILNADKKDELVKKLKRFLAKGEQIYWVCPLVEQDAQSEDLTSIKEAALFLQKMLPEVKVASVHGKAKDKEAIFADFASGEIQILVATTVIEVGVDVPNATVIVIEDAARLGLSSLHQLRGRVGRGHKPSFCILLYKEPIAQDTKTRLKVIKEHNDGFIIAEEDLKLRGFGEIIGTKQTGYPKLKIANFERDYTILPTARKWAKYIFEHEPKVAKLVVRRWLNNLMDLTQV